MNFRLVYRLYFQKPKQLGRLSVVAPKKIFSVFFKKYKLCNLIKKENRILTITIIKNTQIHKVYNLSILIKE